MIISKIVYFDINGIYFGIPFLQKEIWYLKKQKRLSPFDESLLIVLII